MSVSYIVLIFCEIEFSFQKYYKTFDENETPPITNNFDPSQLKYYVHKGDYSTMQILWFWSSKSVLTRCTIIPEKFEENQIYVVLEEGMSANIEGFPENFIEVKVEGVEKVDHKWKTSSDIMPNWFVIKHVDGTQAEHEKFVPYPEYLKKTGRFELHPFHN